MENTITTYFDSLGSARYPNGAWAATYGDPSDGVDTAYGDTEAEAIENLKNGVLGE